MCQYEPEIPAPMMMTDAVDIREREGENVVC